MRTIVEAAAALRRQEVSSVELTLSCLDRITKHQPRLNAFITVAEDRAQKRAEEMDAELRDGHDRGPLHGIPIALKDVFETKGIRTTCGSRLFFDNVPSRDSAVTEKLLDAGCVLVGKTGMHELAYGVTSNNPHFGTIRNPWNLNHIPGGSSGGSGSAVAAGMVFMAMGSDTGGSIRIPAAFCGTVGLKPTYGRVSRYGVMPLDFSLDHMGPLTRSVRDAAIVLHAIAGEDYRDHTSSTCAVDAYLPAEAPSLNGMRIGIPENFFFARAHPGVLHAVRKMATLAESIGGSIVPVRVPDIHGLNTVGRVILLAEASAAMEPFLHRRAEFGADVLSLLDQGSLLAATDYVQAQRLRRLFQLEFAALFKSVDCLLTPTTPTPAPRVGQLSVDIEGTSEDTRLASTRYVRGVNVLGLPALAMPCGIVDGLPVSVQLIGRPFEERLLLKLGAALEDASGGSTTLPPEL